MFIANSIVRLLEELYCTKSPALVQPGVEFGYLCELAKHFLCESSRTITAAGPKEGSGAKDAIHDTQKYPSLVRITKDIACSKIIGSCISRSHILVKTFNLHDSFKLDFFNNYDLIVGRARFW